MDFPGANAGIRRFPLSSSGRRYQPSDQERDREEVDEEAVLRLSSARWWPAFGGSRGSKVPGWFRCWQLSLQKRTGLGEVSA